MQGYARLTKYHLFPGSLRFLSRVAIGACAWYCLASSQSAKALTTVNINAIQSDLPASPYLGQTVTTTGIVIAVLPDGFYIENPQSSWDSDICTAEGIYVYTPSVSPSSLVALQESVTVTGVVEASNNSKYAGTQIYIAAPSSSNLVVGSSGNTLPTAVGSSTLTSATAGTCSLYAAGSFGQWLPFEGMRVNLPSSSSLLVTQGTGGTVNAAAQSAISNGQFWAVLTTTRPFRGPGIDVLDPAYALAPSTVTVWSGNPQLLLVDSTSLGGTSLDASAGTQYTGSSNLVGIIDYHVSTQGYTGFLLTADSVAALSKQSGATPVAASNRLSSDQITIATQDLDGLVASETNRIEKLANAIVGYEHSPDIVAVQDATPDALNLLLSAIASAGGPGYGLTNLSTADSSGLVNAFLVNPDKFDGTPAAAQVLATNTYTSTSGTTGSLFDRSPLLLKAKIPRHGISDFPVYAVNVSLLARDNLASATLSADTRVHREQQAELLTTQVLEPLEAAGDHVIVEGGINSFEFSDGYVDTTGIIDGSEASSGAVWLYDSSYNSQALLNSTTSSTNLTAAATNPAASRYTYVESGSAEQLDHILFTSEMSSLVSIDYARIGADFPASDTYDTSTVARASTHDGIIAYLTVPYPTTTTVVTSGSPSYYDASVTFTATVTVTGDKTGAAGTPDGTVTFLDTDGTTLGSATLSGGVAAFSISSLTVGTHTITASYGGSETNLGYQASSGTVQQVVVKDVVSLALGSSPNPSYYGQPVLLTATASSSGVTPSGAVTFTDTTTGTTLGTETLASGVASLTVSTLSIGAHILQASYGGDATNSTATSNTVTQVVQTNTTTMTLVSSNNPSYYGDNVTFTVTAAGSYGTPTGTLIFYNGATALGSASLTSGVATFTTSALPVGTDPISAVYGGDGTHAAATSNVVDQVVQPVYTPVSTLTCAPNPAEYGSTITCTDTLASAGGIPGGTVTFYDGTTELGTASLTSGVATFSTSSLVVGTHPITADYARSGAFLATVSNIFNEIIASTFSLTASPASHTVYTGEKATSIVTVVPGTGFTLDVALTCSGLPANTTCSLTPATVTGGSGTSTLVIQTTAPSQTTTAANRREGAWPLLAGLLLLVPRRFRRWRGWTMGVLLVASLALTTVTGCGGSGALAGGTPTGSQTITITGTAVDGTLTLTQTTTVTVNVESLF